MDIYVLGLVRGGLMGDRVELQPNAPAFLKEEDALLWADDAGLFRLQAVKLQVIETEALAELKNKRYK